MHAVSVIKVRNRSTDKDVYQDLFHWSREETHCQVVPRFKVTADVVNKTVVQLDIIAPFNDILVNLFR